MYVCVWRTCIPYTNVICHDILYSGDIQVGPGGANSERARLLFTDDDEDDSPLS